jgi:hypothetical protein
MAAWFLLSLSGGGLFVVQADATEPRLDKAVVERGRYVTRLSGCNDCHTPGHMMNNRDVPVEQWLSSHDFGWRGPLGHDLRQQAACVR